MAKIQEISREFEFSAAHMLPGHEKCGRLHGHNYRGIVTISGPLADGMVFDFNLISMVIEQYDHVVLLPAEPKAIPTYDEMSPDVPLIKWSDYQFPLKDVRIISFSQTTAENIARAISKDLVLAGSQNGFRVQKIVVELWENDRSSVVSMAGESSG